LIKIAKGKYQEWLTPEGLTVLEGLARDGLTDELICKKIGIGARTFYEWMERFPQMAQAIKKGKAPVDIQVENALLKRALGYDYEETITEVEELAGGRQKKHIRKVTKHMPADTTAQIFWLKNRKPERWRDKIEQVQTVGNELLESLMQLERRAKND
jgi:hypothetical protein